MRRIIVSLVLLVWALTALAGPTVTASWTPPTEGTTAVEYRMELYADDVLLATYYDISDTFYVLPDIIEPVIQYTVRVRGHDADGVGGPWSDYSDPYVSGVEPGGLAIYRDGDTATLHFAGGEPDANLYQFEYNYGQRLRGVVVTEHPDTVATITVSADTAFCAIVTAIDSIGDRQSTSTTTCDTP